MTFPNHPLSVISPENEPPLLTTQEEKIQLISRFDIDNLVIMPFTEKVAAQKPEVIVRFLSGFIPLRKVVVGYNFHFGHNASGTITSIRKLGLRYGFEVTVMPPAAFEGTPVSSTRIRTLLLVGESMQAAGLMGRGYMLSGETHAGKQIGRNIGFPTVNLCPQDKKLIPKRGVYTTMMSVGDGDWVPAVTNVGSNPTVNSHYDSVRIESHGLHGVDVAYGEHVRIVFLDRLRDEVVFSGLDALKGQLAHDVAAAKALHLEKLALYKALIP